MADLPFLDTNILLRHLTRDHPEHTRRASAYLACVEAGEVRVRTADTVIFETVFTLQRHYRQSRETIRASLLPIIALPGIVLPGKRKLRRAFEIYVTFPALSFADAYHTMLMERLQLTEMVSFDRGFDAVPGINRVEP